MNQYQLHDLRMHLLADYPVIEGKTAREAILNYLHSTNSLTPYTDVECSSDRDVPFLIKKIGGKKRMGYRIKTVEKTN